MRINLRLLFCAVLSVLGSIVTIAFFYPLSRFPWFGIIVAAGIFFCFYYLGLLQSRREEFSNKAKLFIGIASFILSALLMFSLKGPQNFLLGHSALLNIVIYGGTFFAMGMLIAASLFVLASIKWTITPREVPKRFFWIYFILIFSCGLVYLIAFYPAGMSPDSLASWRQAHTFEFNDWHPIFFTWTIMVLVQIWDSPAIMTLFQNLVLSSFLAYSFYQLQKLGIRPVLLFLMCLIIMVIPTFGVYTIIIWKDVLFSATILIFTVHLFLIVHSNGEWLKYRLNFILFFLSSFGVVFYRHNGFPIFIVTMIVLILLYRKQLWKKAGLIFAVLFLAHQFVTGPVFNWLDVKPSDPNEALAIPTQQIANIIVNDGNLTEEQLAYYDEILPIEVWKEKYQPHTVDPIKFTWDQYRRDVIFADFPKYLKTWGQVVVQNPGLATEGFLKHTALVWQISTPPYGYTNTYFTFIMENEFGETNKVISEPVTEKVTAYLEKSKSASFVKKLWRPALYAAIILYFSILLLARNGYKSTVIILPFLLNVASIMAAMPAQEFRYLFANVLLTFVIPFMALVKPKKGGEVENA
ncbi:DUF6020 family protein [Bacillus tianshenii]|uniref:DUF6020 family protein n=1 Tax=Sutcliffiella tianshenii TaxID=1463404 RepID=UPI001CD28F9E|nr:DUF6020 family protein [Bacillus tianshenii]MCA1320495.1 DUF6020 family protein [Bacillus tianshenii]